MRITKLEWDSAFFGFPIGKVDCENDTLNISHLKQQMDSFKLLYIFSKDPIKNNDANLVDEKVVLENHLSSNNKIGVLSLDNKIMILPFDKKLHNRNTLQDLAVASGVYSRFFLDENFKTELAIKLYHEWINISIDDNLNYKVFVALYNTNVVGLITVELKDKDTCRIGLISIFEEYRQKGIASALIHEALKFAFDNNLKTIEVATQNNNKQALNLYLKNNFNVKNITYVYHLWNI